MPIDFLTISCYTKVTKGKGDFKMTTSKLKFMPYAQACVIITNAGAKSLVSYQTQVATIDTEGWLHINGLYSMTTRKHIKAFVKEYVPFEMPFETIKHLANNNIVMNIHTGEIKEI